MKGIDIMGKKELIDLDERENIIIADCALNDEADEHGHLLAK